MLQLQQHIHVVVIKAKTIPLCELAIRGHL